MNDDDHSKLTFYHAQYNQPWTVPYRSGVVEAQERLLVPHIMASHAVLHAMKSLGKLATVFEKLDHREVGMLTEQELTTIENMSADLVTVALRLGNMYNFPVADVLTARIWEKNGVHLPSWTGVE